MSTLSALLERVQRPLQTLRDGDARAPPEPTRRLVHRQRVTTQLAGALGSVPDRQAAAFEGDECLSEIVHRGLDAGADVERRAVDRVDRRERDIARGQV